jgi:hypothetical protein
MFVVKEFSEERRSMEWLVMIRGVLVIQAVPASAQKPSI